MTTPLIAFIGAGHMGASLIGGLLKNGHPPEKIIAADPQDEKCQALTQRFHIHATTDNAEAVEAAEVVILAVKPQMARDVLAPLKTRLNTKKPLFISVAAGLPTATLANFAGDELAIVRTMPNTPALIGHGATALFANPHVNEHQRALAESILRAVGITVWLENETLMDAVTALSGSGPAYFFFIMDALQAAGEAAGLPKDTARLLTLQTALGAAAMAMESDSPLSTLQHNVTSKGGTTEQAISVLEQAKLGDILKAAFQAAQHRSQTLARELGDTH
ncbi:MAG TPA: pyrroline-5-carboxylate reductase [Gammaproteobacteria bacterium]|nr:pyrroline-5-carboxylate reductase [Gammaproteobacteria bacterium]